MTIIILSDQSFVAIKEAGHGVPRNKDNYVISRFKVGNKYTIKPVSGTTETLIVKCTNDFPHLTVVK